ncbi:hypothetical protein C2S52_008019 [Perilla frutescens var. hirtella]|nr:hypothetical protein C2S52_008019 [Perilla frutescens var. hirtella]
MSSDNGTLAGDGFSPAVATWYGSPYGSGSVGGACGLGNDVENFPYYGMISAGNQNIFRSGAGCGSCYMVKCTENPHCSGSPITVTVTDECPGSCNDEAFHFDLSGKAFGYLAKNGEGCYYKSKIALKIDLGSNPYYLAFTVENVNGDGEIGFIYECVRDRAKMAYGGVISLKQIIQRLLDSSPFSVYSSTRQILGFSYKEATSLQEVLKRLDDRDGSRGDCSN